MFSDAMTNHFILALRTILKDALRSIMTQAKAVKAQNIPAPDNPLNWFILKQQQIVQLQVRENMR